MFIGKEKDLIWESFEQREIFCEVGFRVEWKKMQEGNGKVGGKNESSL